jgi:hypothetical protein
VWLIGVLDMMMSEVFYTSLEIRGASSTYTQHVLECSESPLLWGNDVPLHPGTPDVGFMGIPPTREIPPPL